MMVGGMNSGITLEPISGEGRANRRFFYALYREAEQAKNEGLKAAQRDQSYREDLKSRFRRKEEEEKKPKLGRSETLVTWVNRGSGYFTELPTWALNTEQLPGEARNVFTTGAVYIEKHGIVSPAYWTGVSVQ